ncbi:hypothetical protein H6776_00385 [Candidatus Nomurabacteria bacterium]|nr:hypothetical protein [Candidatus Nomurabacteria bacterium]
MFSIDSIVFFVLLADSLVANIIAWFGSRWYLDHFQIMSRWLPLTKAWSLGYFLIVLWVGSILLRAGAF